MDVLVVWEDQTVNVVKSSDLRVAKRKPLAKGTKVKMWYEKKWYSGTILDVENNISDEFNSSDEEPLVLLKNKLTTNVPENPVAIENVTDNGNNSTELSEGHPLNSANLIPAVFTSVAENNCEKLEGNIFGKLKNYMIIYYLF